jgi:hypothetical protein
MICQWFDLKITVTVSPDLTSKSVVVLSLGLAIKSMVKDFSVYVSKSTATVW